MDNPYTEYYFKQAGNGLVGFSGHRYQSGNGFFGKILKYVKPALRYIGKQGWSAFQGIGNDVLSGDSLGDASKKQLLRTSHDVLRDVDDELVNLKKQRGMGKRRKRKRKSIKTIKSKKTKSKKLYKRKRKTKSKKKRKAKKF
jgi:hypothetical protein